MTSETELELSKSLSKIKEELRSGFSNLKRELTEEHSAAVKKMKSSTAPAPKFKKKSNEKQFEVNSHVLAYSIGILLSEIYTASSRKSFGRAFRR